MDSASFTPHVVGLAMAAGAVVAGVPLFSAGMSALRLRRSLASLAPGDDANATPATRPVSQALPESEGFAHLHGRTALESPLFSPLSGVPCAGYDLEVSAVGAHLRRTISQRRVFRVLVGRSAAHIHPAPGRWDVGVTAEREIQPDSPVSEGLAALIAHAPEAQWWRRKGGTLYLVERALKVGAECHVVGYVRHASVVMASATEWLRTGTDDAPVAVTNGASGEVTIGSGDPAEFLLVADRAPHPRELRIPLWRAAGAFAGPLLGLLGVLYLASAAQYFRGLGRF
jgi:hypothetical protein